MAIDLQQIEEGWTVVGADGAKVGTVKAIHQDHLVVEGGTLLKHDLFIPVDALTELQEETVVVNVPASAADDEGWRYPPQAAYEPPSPVRPEVPDTTTMTVAGYATGTLSSPEAQGFVQEDTAATPEAAIPNAGLDSGSPHPGAEEALQGRGGLRARGYPVVDVPLGLLLSRLRYQVPDLVLCDADAPDALATRHAHTGVPLSIPAGALATAAIAHAVPGGSIEVGAPADLLLLGPIRGSRARDSLEAFRLGDVPGLSTVVVDGASVIHPRTDQLPPPRVLASVRGA
jgi:hypothetical protein